MSYVLFADTHSLDSLKVTSRKEIFKQDDSGSPAAFPANFILPNTFISLLPITKICKITA